MRSKHTQHKMLAPPKHTSPRHTTPHRTTPLTQISHRIIVAITAVHRPRSDGQPSCDIRALCGRPIMHLSGESHPQRLMATSVRVRVRGECASAMWADRPGRYLAACEQPWPAVLRLAPWQCLGTPASYFAVFVSLSCEVTVSVAVAVVVSLRGVPCRPVHRSSYPSTHPPMPRIPSPHLVLHRHADTGRMKQQNGTGPTPVFKPQYQMVPRRDSSMGQRWDRPLDEVRRTHTSATQPPV
jgi:hypothetical protein